MKGDHAAEPVPAPSRLRELAGDFAPRRLGPTLVVGIVTGVLVATLAISLAALIFRGDLAAGFPLGVGLALFGSLVIGVVTTLGGRTPGAVAGIQDNTSAVIAVSVAGLAGGVGPGQEIPTAVAFIVAASGLTALALVALGVSKMGGLVRFVPYPVIGGFLVATGILILDGARSLLIDAWGDLLTFDVTARWLPGIVFALAVLAMNTRSWGRIVLPWAITLSTVGFHVVLALGGVPRADALGRGWLLGPFPDEALWRPDTLRLLADADWSAVAGAWGGLVTVVVIAVLALLINVHAFDRATGEDMDVDRALTVTGFATALAAPGGGPPGYMYLSHSLLLRRLAGPSRGAALVAVLVGGVVLLAGGTVLEFVPTFVVAGLLAYLGATFLIDWLWDQRHSLQRADYAIVAGSGVAVVLFGFLTAIALGTAVAIVLFVVRYSWVDPIRHFFTLATFRSPVDRSPAASEMLTALGSSVIVFEVHGFLFFGTAFRVFGDPRIVQREKSLTHVVFDLSRVTGIDSSSGTALAKLARTAAAEGFEIVLVAPSAGVDQLTAQIAGHHPVTVFSDLDSAAEWCEERLLASEPDLATGTADVGLAARLETLLGSGALGTEVVKRFERRDLVAGEVLIAFGEESAGLFYLQSGALSARLDTANGESVLLRKMQPGTLMGEISLYLGGTTSAKVVADEPSTVLHLSPQALTELERTDPTLAAVIHRLAARTLAGRVLHAERVMRALQD